MRAALLLLASFVAASPAQNWFPQLQIQETVVDVLPVATPQSLIDQMYGELVDTPESREHRKQLAQQGVVVHVEEEQFVDVELNVDTPWKLAQLLERANQLHRRKLRHLSHQSYLRLSLKLRLPADDDTSDISGGINLFGGILTFGGFENFDCFDPEHFDKEIDIAIVGAPFDTGTSFRPGARFGPEAIRLGARRLYEGLTPVRGKGLSSKLGRVDPYNPKSHNLTIIDCGDVPMTPFDNRIALHQLYRGQRAIHNHTTTHAPSIPHPKVITMGGDHTITLMALRSTFEKYGKLAVLHFDSHIDTWDPKVLGGGITDYMSLNHGTFLHYAAEQGYLAQDHCFHVGLRAPYISPDYDIEHDHKCGFSTITARDLDTLGRDEIVATIKKAVGDLPVYISVDIDVLDPAYAPGTGTMEVGGWTTRELLSVLDGLEGIDVVGGDVVEVSPPFDSNSEITSLAATAVIDSLLGLMIVEALD